MSLIWYNQGMSEIKRLSDLKPQLRNANKHTSYGLRLMEQSIQADGFIDAQTAAADGEIISGSARLELEGDKFADVEPIIIHSDGQRPIIVVRDDIPNANHPRARRLSVAANQIAKADYDPDGALLKEWAGEDAQIKKMFADDEWRELTGEEKEQTDAEPQIDRAEALLEKWQVKAGDLWQIGAHRLLCGDCTDAAVVARVMGGEKVELVWTDPPYGVSVGDKNKYLNSIAPCNRIEENLENDTLDEPRLTSMLNASFDNMIKFCTAGAGWYVAAPAVPLHLLFGQALKERGIWRQTIQWVKDSSTFSPMGVCYHWQAEPIFFGWLPNGAHRYYGGRTQTTVWNIKRPSKSPEHPTMKPVELVARGVENSSQKDEIVADPFAGSGTTLVACENLGRKCRAIEISPAYVAVCIERMSVAFPGIKIERI
jgi:DNA modification methylase